MDWKAILPEQDSYTLADIQEATKELKLADLATGEYVAKAKFDDKLKEAKTLAAELAELKTATDGDDGLKKQIEALSAKLELANRETADAAARLTDKERYDAAFGKIGDTKLAKLAVIEASAFVNEDTDFDAALSKLIETDPGYVKQDPAPAPARVMDSGPESKGAPTATDTDRLETVMRAAAGVPKE